MKTEEHINRYGDVFKFTPNQDNNVMWEGDFKYHRYGFDKEGKRITMVDPSGGPYLAEGMPSTLAHSAIKGRKIDRFEWIDEIGYLIYLKK